MPSACRHPREHVTQEIAALTSILLSPGLPALQAQAPQPAETRFEVASIAPNETGNAQMVIRTRPSGLVSATNVNLIFLLRYAYDIPEVRIVDAPDWATTEHFHVTARGRPGATVSEFRQLFRGLLADRFSLMARIGQREMSIDTLARTGAPLGPQLHPSSSECETEGAPPPTLPSELPQCSLRIAFGRIDGTGQRMASLVLALGRLTGRHVVDETDLTGQYDFALTYTPDAVLLDPATRVEFPAIDPNGPALNTALQEQLGLGLRTTRGLVDVLIVESASRPTPN